MKRLKLNKWVELNSHEFDGLINRMIHYVSVACNIEPHIIYEWDVNDIMEKYKEIKWVIQPINISDSKKNIIAGDLELHLIKFNNITLGQFIDLSFYIKEGYIQSMPEIVSTIYLQMEKEKFKKSVYEKYGEVDIEERARYIEDKIDINDVYGSVLDFLKWRENIFSSYDFWDNSLDGINPEDLNQEEMRIYNEELKRLERNKSTMWEDILSSLSNGDITKYNEILGTNIFLVFNRLAKQTEENRKSNKK